MGCHHLIDEKALSYQEYLERESDVRHHTYEEERYQFDLLQAGDPRAMEEFDRRSRRSESDTGTVSDDPLRNKKYLTVCCIASACRAAIQGGLDAKRAYRASDLYIRKMDVMENIEEIEALSRDAFCFYLCEVQKLDKKRTFSRPVAQCLDYIYNHLHQPITLQELADACGLSQGYLSTVFKEELGLPVSAYIMAKRMEAARNMLRYSEYSSADISAILAFSSQSHFIRAFKKYVGQTPKAYRESYRLSGEGPGMT